MRVPGIGLARVLPQTFSVTMPRSKISSIEYLTFSPANGSPIVRQSTNQFGRNRISRGPVTGTSNLISPRQFVRGGGSRGKLAPASHTFGNSVQIGQPVLPLRSFSAIFFVGCALSRVCVRAEVQRSKPTRARRQNRRTLFLPFDLIATDSPTPLLGIGRVPVLIRA